MKDTQNKIKNLSWTHEEVRIWMEAGLIPTELFDPSRIWDLNAYINQNIEKLHEHYHRNFEEDRYRIDVPPQSEWHKAPDITVTDQKTGQVVSMLEMGADFQLFAGITFKIRAKEIKEWEKETATARNFDEKEKRVFIQTIEKIGTDKPLSRKEIVKIIEEIRRPNRTFRQSRELIDNKLDHKIENYQLTFDDFINPPTSLKNPTETLIKGLDFNQGEDRLVHTLTLLLNRKSENKDQKSSDYYMGNFERGLISIDKMEMETARIVIKPHELYSTYYGKNDYGADQIKFVLNLLDNLSKKQFLTTWNFQTPTKGKNLKKKISKFRTYLPLFQTAILNNDLSESESQEVDNNTNLIEGKKCLFLFKFQPQFTNNIRERYVEFPEDIYHRISKAVGKDKYSQCINLMRDFLFREKQQKRREIIRDKDTMISILKLDKYKKEGRKKLVNDRINECRKVFQKIGLIENWEEIQGASGQTQYKMTINLGFK